MVAPWPASRQTAVAVRRPSSDLSRVRPVSTRKLILAAMLCGLAILVAFAVQVIIAR
jgi:hypothetical protein